LTEAARRPLKSEDAATETTTKGWNYKYDPRYFYIYGNTFVLKYEDLKNLSIEYFLVAKKNSASET
jgi:hypothetical protein